MRHFFFPLFLATNTGFAGYEQAPGCSRRNSLAATPLYLSIAPFSTSEFTSPVIASIHNPNSCLTSFVSTTLFTPLTSSTASCSSSSSSSLKTCSSISPSFIAASVLFLSFLNSSLFRAIFAFFFAPFWTWNADHPGGRRLALALFSSFSFSITVSTSAKVSLILFLISLRTGSWSFSLSLLTSSPGSSPRSPSTLISPSVFVDFLRYSWIRVGFSSSTSWNGNVLLLVLSASRLLIAFTRSVSFSLSS